MDFLSLGGGNQDNLRRREGEKNLFLSKLTAQRYEKNLYTSIIRKKIYQEGFF